MDRVRFFDHQGKRILLVDLSHCTPPQLVEVAADVVEVVASEPRHSVLLLADFTGAQFNHEAVTHLKEAMVLDKPHLKRSAWIGTDTLPKAVYENMKAFSQRELPIFQSREEALEYLVGESRAA